MSYTYQTNFMCFLYGYDTYIPLYFGLSAWYSSAVCNGNICTRHVFADARTICDYAHHDSK